MTRVKPRRRVKIDLSWPLGLAGIDKNLYLDSNFCLIFPTIDDITGELRKLGCGTLLYNIDVSCVFRHVKVNPDDYDLLGLEWNGHYTDMCVLFGTRHGSQIFSTFERWHQVCHAQRGHTIIVYDYVCIGVPSCASYTALIDLMNELGMNISQIHIESPTYCA